MSPSTKWAQAHPWSVDIPIDEVGAYARVRRMVPGDRAGHVLQYPIISSGLKPNSQELLTLLAEDPYRKPPPFEKPVGDLAGAYSQHINIQHRPACQHQRCWVHKTANVLNKLPKSMQPKVKEALHDIWMAATRAEAHAAFDRAQARFSAKYPKAMECLAKDRKEMLAFYDFPAEHWPHIRTTNPIESTFATVRLRTKRTRNCGSRDTTLAMVYKLLESAQKNWKRIKGFNLLTLVVNNVEFKDGEQVTDQSDRNVA